MGGASEERDRAAVAIDTVTCPECGGTAKRDRRFLKHGRTPFICGECRAWMIDEAEPVQQPEGGFLVLGGDDE